MKKRIIALLLALIMTLSFIASCGPADDPPIGPPGDEHRHEFRDGMCKCGEKDPNYKPDAPGVGDLSGGYTFEDIAELTTSKDRLENADFSFNFDMTSDVSAQKVTNKKAEKSFKKHASQLYGTSDNTDGYVFSGNLDDLIAGRTDYNMFESVKDSVESAGSYARQVADWFIENIYVMDTVLTQYGYGYVMSHDEESDTLTVIKFGLYVTGLPKEYCKITIYYDNEGDEVVEMQRINHYSRDSVVYAPGKYYEYSSSWGFAGTDLYNGNEIDEYNYSIAVAYKENGLWYGMDTSFSTASSLFSPVGSSYDRYEAGMDNGILVNTFRQTEYGDFHFLNYISPRRANGEMIGSYSEELGGEDFIKRADDVYKVINGIHRINHSEIGDRDWGPDMFTLETFIIGLDSIRGWDNVSVKTSVSKEEANGCFNTQEQSTLKELCITVGDNEVILPKIWSATHGALEDAGWDEQIGQGRYIRVSDGAMLLENEIDFTECIYMSALAYVGGEWGSGDAWVHSDTLDEIKINFYPTPIRNHFWEPSLGGYTASFDDMKEMFISTVEAFFEQNGLSYETDESFPRYLLNMSDASASIANSSFEKVTGYKLSGEGFKNFALTTKSVDVELYNNLEAMQASYVSEEMDDEKLAAYKQLGASLLKLDGNISGSVGVSESGIDFRGLNIALPKSTLLSSGKRYGVVVTLGVQSTKGIMPVFELKEYNGASLTFESNSVLNHNDSLWEGKYVLCAYYVREKDDLTTRISDPVALPVNAFEGFEREYTLDDKGALTTYISKYDFVNGNLVVSVDIKDNDPPVIIINGTSYDEESNTYTYRFEESLGKTVRDLIGALDVYDRVDGPMAVSVDSISKGGEAVVIGTVLNDGEVYTVSASDIRGNTATVNVLIETYKADTGDTVPPVITVSGEGVEYDSDLGVYVYSYSELTPKSVIDLLSLVNAYDEETGAIPLEVENITFGGMEVDINDSLLDCEIYVITVEDANLNQSTAEILIKIIYEE